MIETKKLVGLVEGVYNVKYDGEPLYNILLKEYGTMVVNNLITETLDPENVIAKLYSGKYSLDSVKSEKMFKKGKSKGV